MRKLEADSQAWRGHLNIFSPNAYLKYWWWGVVLGGGARETTLLLSDQGFILKRTVFFFFFSKRERKSNIWLWCIVSHVWLCAPCTVAHEAPLSLELSRKEYWSALPFLSSGDLSNPGIKPLSPALQMVSCIVRFFTNWATRKPKCNESPLKNYNQGRDVVWLRFLNDPAGNCLDKEFAVTWIVSPRLHLCVEALIPCDGITDGRSFGLDTPWNVTEFTSQ